MYGFPGSRPAKYAIKDFYGFPKGIAGSPSTLPNQELVGTVFRDNFGRSTPAEKYSITAPDVTFSQNGNFLRAARATTGGFANYIQLLWPSSTQGFVSELITFKLRFWIVTHSVGVSLGWKSLSGNSIVDFTGIFVTGTTGYAGAYHNGTDLTPHSSILNTANGNQCELEVTRGINVITVIAKRLDGSGNVSNSVTKTYSLATAAGPLAMSVSQLAVYFHGGTYDLESLTVDYGLFKYARISFIGDSITQWYFASNHNNRFAELAMAGSSFGYMILAGQGQRTAELLKCIDELTILKPKYAAILIGTNDKGTGVSDLTFQQNFRSFVEQVISIGIIPILFLILPRDGYDFRPQTQDSYNRWILNEFDNDSRVIIIDTFTDSKDPAGNGYNSTYSGDGVHPNDTGENVISNRIRKEIPFILGI